ncbi:histidine kinase [Amycolatopsis alkalitolerans]|uniref:histidine kinase n=1 Tax=Amycolatopsis alkalitolerans TaxID=2547244 RepID=A0A5C4MAA3_9PSEU|nr:histidine kinase [Amycolatopsis alkalitolerans]TNC28941.1 sensor histidine kinase [Amycolatopsis alkalitolerans]
MTPGIRRERYSLALDSLRWLLVLIPLISTAPRYTPLTWPLAAVALVASLPMLWLPSKPAWLLPAGLIVLAAASGTLWVLHPASLVSVVVFTTIFYASRFVSLWTALAIGLVMAGTTTALFLRYDVTLRNALLDISLIAVVILLGLNRRDRVARLEQTELALARARTAAEEHALAAALAERARIARELHDVLAHSLSGLALNLQGARLMLIRDGASAEALAQIERAQQLAADGLGEARQAVAALRDDPVPLERAIEDLLAGYRLDTSAPAALTVRGEPRAIDAATSTTLLRAVQEALSNTRKHAPGARVRVELAYSAGEVEVTVLDQQGKRPAPGTSPGYGLRGMRERAEQLGGRLATGPGEDGWRVQLTVPA